MDEVYKFRAILLSTGMEFMHKMKKLAAARSPEGAEFMSNEDVVRELVRRRRRNSLRDWGRAPL